MDTTKSGTAELVTAPEVEALPASGRRLDELIPVGPLQVRLAQTNPVIRPTARKMLPNTSER